MLKKLQLSFMMTRKLFLSTGIITKVFFSPGFGKPIQKINIASEDSGLEEVDHVVGNVRVNEMNLWENYLNKSFEL